MLFHVQNGEEHSSSSVNVVHATKFLLGKVEPINLGEY